MHVSCVELSAGKLLLGDSVNLFAAMCAGNIDQTKEVLKFVEIADCYLLQRSLLE